MHETKLSAITSLRDGHKWYYHPKLHSLAMLSIANSMVADVVIYSIAVAVWAVALKSNIVNLGYHFTEPIRL